MSGRSHRFLGITSTFLEVNVSCSRIQHGDPSEDRTWGHLSLRSLTLYHSATAPPLTIFCSCTARFVGLCRARSETPKTGFRATRLRCLHSGRNVYQPRHEKTVFSICENKDADQLRGNGEADQRLYFRFSDSTIPLVPKYEISSL